MAAFAAASVEAHGGLTFPPPRNNHNNIAPTNLSYQPGSLVRGWQGGSCAGDMCLWFSDGCYIGCPNCSSEIPIVPGASGEVPDRYAKVRTNFASVNEYYLTYNLFYAIFQYIFNM